MPLLLGYSRVVFDFSLGETEFTHPKELVNVSSQSLSGDTSEKVGGNPIPANPSGPVYGVQITARSVLYKS